MNRLHLQVELAADAGSATPPDDLEPVGRTVGDEVEEPAAASGLTPVGVIGGIESLLYSRLYRDELDDLASLVPSLMYFAVLPYLGLAAAQEEMELPAG